MRSKFLLTTITTISVIAAVLHSHFLHSVKAQDTGWMIESFMSSLTIHSDASITVTETISVDFNGLEKHGIFRTIPRDYADRYGNKYSIRLNVEAVTDELGKAIPHKVGRGKDIEIKIGDPNTTITGKQTYTIRYKGERVITSFPDHDELYWNVTGDKWPVPIKYATIRGEFPKPLSGANCFSGPFGSLLRNCSLEIQGKTLQATSSVVLSPGEGLTLVAALPKGAVTFPGWEKHLLWFASDNWPYALPLLTLIVLLWLYWREGRDESYKSLFDPSKGEEKLPLFPKELVPSTYAPLTDVKPAEAGTLIDEEVNIRDIAATIIDLAVRGYLRIEELEPTKRHPKDFLIERTQKEETELEPFERELLKGLCKLGKKTTLSAQKYHFFPHLRKIRDALYDKMVEKGYCDHRFDKTTQFYRGAGVAVAGVGVALIVFSDLLPYALPWIIGLVASGGLISLFAKAMPRRTAKGRREYLRVLGLRNFVALGAYREQLWEKATIFEEVLPFAIAFDLTHEWAEAMKAASVPPPNWYKGTQDFNLLNFSHSLESFTQATTVNLPAKQAPAAARGVSGMSSGGGFSGGGFGGGGGGSW